MTTLPDEIRLLIFVAVQALVMFASWRFVSRFVASRLQQAIDAFLLTYLIQYIAVGLPGMVGVLSQTAMLAVAGLVALILLVLTPSTGTPGEGGGEGEPAERKFLPPAGRPHPRPLPAYRARGPEIYILLAEALFVVGYVTAYIGWQQTIPPMATDALTYHFPAAVQWLQHGRIDLFQTWFFNPANTYSPLAGSVFEAWLLGPIGSDALACFTPAPMVLLIFLAVVAIARSLMERENAWSGRPASAGRDIAISRAEGMNTEAQRHREEKTKSSRSTMDASESNRQVVTRVLFPVLIGLVIALSRPIVSQIDKGKDDLFLAAFFAVAAGALSTKRLRDPLGPWRVGVAVGLCLAVKYTALLAMPMLLFAIDAPFRARWRWASYLKAAVCVVAIAGPWYVRNLVLTGNPLFPADFLWLHGLLSTARSFELRSVDGILGVLLHGPFAVPGLLAAMLLITWLGAAAIGARRAIREPMVRLVLIGPMVGIAIFLFTSPYPEIRFVVPALLLMISAAADFATMQRREIAIENASQKRRSCVALAWVVALMLIAICTGLSWSLWQILTLFCGTGIAFAAIGVGILFVQTRWLHLRRDVLLLIGGAAALLFAGYAYVNWTAFIHLRQVTADAAWARPNTGGDPRQPIWDYVRNQIPADEPLAYTGTFTVYPLMGFRLDRPVVYVPVRPGVKTIADLPRLGDRLTGEQIQSAAMAATIGGADSGVWLSNLQQSGAKHLVIFTHDLAPSSPSRSATPPPIEWEWARSLPPKFRLEFENEAGAVYRVMEP